MTSSPSPASSPPLSYARSNLTEGAQPGHAIRTCLIGMRIGHRTSASHEDQLSDLYYALLLKDAGCSSNASRHVPDRRRRRNPRQSLHQNQ